MLKDFLFQTCTIIKQDITDEDGEETISDTIIKENIKCKMYERKPNLANIISQTEDNGMYKMILEPIDEVIEEGYIIKVYDNSVYIGDYRTKNRSIPFRKRNGQVDHLELTLEKWEL